MLFEARNIPGFNRMQDLMDYFGVTDRMEFDKFWFWLSADERHYYRTVDLAN